MPYSKSVCQKAQLLELPWLIVTACGRIVDYPHMDFSPVCIDRLQGWLVAILYQEKRMTGLLCLYSHYVCNGEASPWEIDVACISLSWNGGSWFRSQRTSIQLPSQPLVKLRLGEESFNVSRWVEGSRIRVWGDGRIWRISPRLPLPEQCFHLGFDWQNTTSPGSTISLLKDGESPLRRYHRRGGILHCELDVLLGGKHISPLLDGSRMRIPPITMSPHYTCIHRGWWVYYSLIEVVSIHKKNLPDLPSTDAHWLLNFDPRIVHICG